MFDGWLNPGERTRQHQKRLEREAKRQTRAVERQAEATEKTHRALKGIPADGGAGLLVLIVVAFFVLVIPFLISYFLVFQALETLGRFVAAFAPPVALAVCALTISALPYRVALCFRRREGFDPSSRAATLYSIGWYSIPVGFPAMFLMQVSRWTDGSLQQRMAEAASFGGHLNAFFVALFTIVGGVALYWLVWEHLTEPGGMLSAAPDRPNRGRGLAIAAGLLVLFVVLFGLNPHT